MKNKMILKDLKVKSFVTNINSIQSIKGGTVSAFTVIGQECGDTWNCSNHDDCDTITRLSVRCTKSTELSIDRVTCTSGVGG